MHNTNKPTPEELPSSAQLLKSTLIAAAAAVAILVAIVLPSEYGIDPTGIGGILGLAEMGEIKTQLAEEAEADRQGSIQGDDVGRSSLLAGIAALFISPAHAHMDGSLHGDMGPAWTDEVTLTLTPGEGAEIKLVMEEGAVAEFSWTVEDGVVNYDLHGDGDGRSTSYQRDRAVPGHEGTLTAAFTGNHGWFWRNRDDQDVTVTLSVRGDYSAVVRVE